MLHRFSLLAALLAVFTGCATVTPNDACRTRIIQAMPRVSPQLEEPSFWINQWGKKADSVLLNTQEIALLNKSNAERPWAFQDVTASHINEQERTAKELEERQVWLRDRLQSGRYLEANPGLMATASRIIAESVPVDELRVLASRSDLRCIPSTAKLYAPSSTPGFDRNQCSGLANGHLVRVLRRAGPWSYVHGGHSVGWILEPAWTQPLDVAKARYFRDHAKRVVVTKPNTSITLERKGRLGETYPATTSTDAQTQSILLPSQEGLETSEIELKPGLEQGWLPFTRKNVIRLAFSELNRGYGWGESKGLTDCSRLLLDTFRPFGINLGRHSSEQARSGSSVIKLDDMDDNAKLRAIREAAHQGIVFLYMPGHIMLYLGHHEDKDYGLSAIHSFRSLCKHGEGEGETRIEKVVVSDLLVGTRTKKKSFIRRMTKATVFGTQPTH